MKLGLLLIAMGLGYKVYADASKEKGRLRQLGQWVGALMMAVSFATTALAVYSWGTGRPFCPSKGFCPFMKAPAASVAPAK